MEPIRTLRSRTVVLGAANIDTDQIIPARFLTTTTRAGLGEHLFADWRYDANGAPRGDFILNGAEARNCSILVAGRNFGCGSSREHAPIALGAAGCEVVVAESFARIFFRNCIATGELYPYDTSVPISEEIKTGDYVEVDFDKDELRANGKSYPLKPLGEVKPVIDAGGIFEFARQSGLIPARVD